MAYISLYRKYRSQSFGEVIGQQHVTTVLQNAIRMGRVAHAYLFCGPRGCGKTSTARLLARALNCQGADGKATAPTPTPCGICPMCVQIRVGSAIDVTEMDAASETGIDDVREKIIENAKYAPAEARYKVYIIDEVHDLSLKAFDSLLKTIEEPPGHVIFILATTEAHKVPITIRSRCQRMDFRRGTLADLIGNIKRVLDAESIGYEVEAVAAVARAAEGSFRDSLSLLEQALAFTDGPTLTAEAVHASIGTVGPQLLDEITQTLASDDRYNAFVKAGELVESGKDVKQTLVALQGHLRDLLVAQIAHSPDALADVSQERFTQLKQQANLFHPTQLLKMLDTLAETERNLRFTNQHQRLLEMAFWNILPSALTAAISTQISTQAVSAPPPVVSRPVAQPTPQAVVEPPRTVQYVQPSVPVQPPPVVETPPVFTPQPPTHTPISEMPATAQQSPSVPATNGQSPAPVEAEAGDYSVQFAGAIDLEGIRRMWPRILKKLIKASPSAPAVFQNVFVMALDGKFVELGFPNEFQRAKADKPQGKEAVEKIIASELGLEGFKVRCVLADAPQNITSSSSVEPVGFSFTPDPAPPGTNGTTGQPVEKPYTNGHHAPPPVPDLPPVPPTLTYEAPREAVVNAPEPTANQNTSQNTSPKTTQNTSVEDDAYFSLVMEELDGQPYDD